MKILAIMTVITALTVLPAGTSLAQEYSPQVSKDVNGDLNIQTGTRQQVSGRIIEEKDTLVLGTDTKHKLVLVEEQSGRRIVVDLGPAQALGNLDIKIGGEISATGKVGWVDGHAVFLAKQVNIGGQTSLINRKYFRHNPP